MTQPLRRMTEETDPSSELYFALERIYRAYGFRAAYNALNFSLTRLAEAHRAELTEQGWIL